MQSLEGTAKLICDVNLDTHYLGWSNNGFYKVNGLSYAWKKRMCKDRECDYVLVAEKVREFLKTYHGALHSQVTKQLVKLEALSPSKPISSKEVKEEKTFVVELSKTEAKKTAGIKILKGLSSTSLPSAEQPNFDQLFLKYQKVSDPILRDTHVMPYSRKSCRFGIRCLSKTIVSVDKILEDAFGYLHANKVSFGEKEKMNFIATLYPLNRVVFWSAVHANGNAIIDLTNEKDWSFHEVSSYSPERVEETRYVEHMKIKCLAASQMAPHFFKYKLLITDLNTQISKEIDRFHYTGWKDEAGTNEAELFQFMQYVEPYLGQEDRLPIVHCMAGMGRTGTYIVAVAIKKLIAQGVITNLVNLEENMQRLIVEGREQRGEEFVRQPSQIETIWNLGRQLLLDPKALASVPVLK